jgi:hypothetical protein
VYEALKLTLVLGYARPLYPEVYGVELGFGIVKLGAVCVYSCPNMRATTFVVLLPIRARHAPRWQVVIEPALLHRRDATPLAESRFYA